MPVFGTRSTEWEGFADQMKNLRTQTPALEMAALEAIRNGILKTLFTHVASKTVWTGTYMQSLQGGVLTIGGKPTVVIELEPTGDEADKLHIYWKVLERGAAPNPSIPSKVLTRWSQERWGTAQVGLSIVRRNKALSRGILPNPVLSRMFILDGNFKAMKLTADGESIVRAVLKELVKVVGSFMRRGKMVTVKRVPAGQFGGGRFTKM